MRPGPCRVHRCSRSARTADDRRSGSATPPSRPGSCCSPSTTIAGPRRTRPDGSTTIPRSSIRAPARWTRCRSSVTRSTTPGSRTRSWRSSGKSPLVAVDVDDAALVAVHRRWPRRRTGTPRLRGLDAARRGRRHAGDPRRLPRPGRRRSTAVRADLPSGAGIRPVPAGVGDRLATRAASCRLTLRSTGALPPTSPTDARRRNVAGRRRAGVRPRTR